MNGPTKLRFEEIFKSGKIIQSSPFRLIHTSGSGKLGIATAKAIGSKPKRNFVKRRVRELIHINKNLLKMDTDYVFIVKETALSMSFSDLGLRFNRLLQSCSECKEEKG